MDKFGTYISKLSYGTQEKYGWEIDHIIPVARGGTDDLDNLQPLHWKNNRKKGNTLEDTQNPFVHSYDNLADF
jgi:5-methylcytosine-specific restriction endonuclease McrA